MEMMKNSIWDYLSSNKKARPHTKQSGPETGTTGGNLYPGRFIWQLVGVLAT